MAQQKKKRTAPLGITCSVCGKKVTVTEVTCGKCVEEYDEHFMHCFDIIMRDRNSPPIGKALRLAEDMTRQVLTYLRERNRKEKT